MNIVCGTDFSDPAAEAGTVAALLARRLDRPLVLVHALDTRGVLFNQAAVLDALQHGAAQRLDAELARLRELGAEVQARVLEGWPDETLLRAAGEVGAELLVLAATGAGNAPRSLLGSTAERVSARASAPLLTVRDAAPLRRWLLGEHRLRVLCALDDSLASEAAIEWMRRLRLIADCELVAARIDPRPDEAARLHLEDRLRRRLGPDAARIVVAPAGGAVAQRLAGLARTEAADLVLAGSHQRHGFDRARRGSVSIGLLRECAASVLVAPASIAQSLGPAAAPEGRRVLVAVALSPEGRHAARTAFALIPDGSRVRLMSVLHPRRAPPHARPGLEARQTPEHEAWRAQCRADLEALLPADPRQRGISVEIDLVGGEEPATAILMAADAIDAELICLGTAGRTGLAAALLGSVAQAVLGRSRRPVLLVPTRQR